MAAYLLINNNNSRTKFALAATEGLGPERAAIPTATLNAETLWATVADWSFERVVVASVVPEKAMLIRSAMQGRPLLEVSAAIALGIAIDFPDPSTIGADRLANAVAMLERCRQGPAVVVDFGTAVTFDILSREGAYVGGIIAPGLEVMTDYMHRRTALLPKIEIEEPAELIGKSTRGAMLSGAVYGYRGLITGILEQLHGELGTGGEPVRTVATGGYAELISAKIPAIDAVVPDLTLEGMRIIANRNPIP